MIVRGFDPLGDLSTARVLPGVGKVIEHHDGGHEQRQGVRDTLARNVGRGPMHGFKHRASFTDVRPGNHAETTDAARTEVTDHIPIEILEQ